ncbi:Mediator of RNA polymerase II transcription subunit 1, partial [Pristimantis euphronides]
MFYIEVQVKKSGHVESVKLAHHGESPMICHELLLLLRTKNFEGFGKSLEGLINLYNIPGNSDIKAKVYRALCSLEEDMTTLFNLTRSTDDKDRISTILHGKVGWLSPRSGGTPMTLEYYIAPYLVLEEKLKLGVRVVGSNVSLTVAGTTNWYRLPVAPLFREIPQEDGSTHGFSCLTEESSMDLPACFFLRFDNPEPILLSLIQQIQNITGLPVLSTNPSPLHELLIRMKHKCLTALTSREVPFIVSLSGCKDHCYVMNSQLENENAMTGALVNKIPFIHPSHVPSILEIVRHQAAYNALLNSCISSPINPGDKTNVLHFEVSLQREFRICISFQNPNGDSLSCVVVDVLSCKELMCSLYSSPSDPPLPYSNEFIMKDLQSCMSIPLTMRTIFQKAEEVMASEDVEIQSAKGNNVLLPFCSEDHKEGVIEQRSILQNTLSIAENIPTNDSDHNEDAFPDEGRVHSGALRAASPCPSQEPNSSYTKDPSYHPVEINSSGLDEQNSSIPEESYSSTAEEPSSMIVQGLSPIMAEVVSPNTAEDPNSSATEKLDSSTTEEFNLSASEPTPENEM